MTKGTLLMLGGAGGIVFFLILWLVLVLVLRAKQKRIGEAVRKEYEEAGDGR